MHWPLYVGVVIVQVQKELPFMVISMHFLSQQMVNIPQNN